MAPPTQPKAKPKSGEPKNVVHRGSSAKDFIASIGDENLKADTLALIDLMKRASGQGPKLWNVGTIGFDSYHYKYDTGREGDCHVLGFYPRKGKITVYLMDGTGPYSELLAKLGKHTKTGYCVYFKRLSEVQLPILEKILRQSYKHVKFHDGHMHRVLESR